MNGATEINEASRSDGLAGFCLCPSEGLQFGFPPKPSSNLLPTSLVSRQVLASTCRRMGGVRDGVQVSPTRTLRDGAYTVHGVSTNLARPALGAFLAQVWCVARLPQPVTENRKVPARPPQLHPVPEQDCRQLTARSNT